MKALTTAAVAVILAVSGVSIPAGSALADKVVVKKTTTVHKQHRPAGGVVVVSPFIPGVAVVPSYRSKNCKRTVTRVDRPGKRPDTKTVKTNC